MKLLARQHTAGFTEQAVREIVRSPVILVSAPRAGSTLMFEQLSKLDAIWTIGGESHAIFREFPNLRVENAAMDSAALTAAHADEPTSDLFRRLFVLFMRNHQGTRFLELPQGQRPEQVCLVEKTPRNALNIPFLLKIFPDARFIYLRRDPKQNVSSLIEAWQLGLARGNFVTFRNLPDWHLPAWCFVLPRGWRDMRGKSVAEIAAFQWRACNTAIMEGLADIPRDRWMTADYGAFVDDPGAELAKVSQFLKLPFGTSPGSIGQMALSRSTVSPPDPNKWRRHEAEIESVWADLSETADQIADFCAVD